MLNTKKLTTGTVTCSQTALALIAAALLVGATTTEASARHHNRHHLVSRSSDVGFNGSWKDANAMHAGSGKSDHLGRYLDQLRFGLPQAPELAHRLDRDTSGCLLFARKPSSLRTLHALLRELAGGQTLSQSATPSDRDGGQEPSLGTRTR